METAAIDRRNIRRVRRSRAVHFPGDSFLIKNFVSLFSHFFLGVMHGYRLAARQANGAAPKGKQWKSIGRQAEMIRRYLETVLKLSSETNFSSSGGRLLIRNCQNCPAWNVFPPLPAINTKLEQLSSREEWRDRKVCRRWRAREISNVQFDSILLQFQFWKCCNLGKIQYNYRDGRTNTEQIPVQIITIRA